MTDANDEQFIQHMHNVTLHQFTMDQLLTYTKQNYPLITHRSVRIRVFIRFIHEQVDTFLQNIVNVDTNELPSLVKTLKVNISAVHACLTVTINIEVEILKFLYSRLSSILQSDIVDVDQFFNEQKEKIEREIPNKSQARKQLYQVLEDKITEVVKEWITHNKFSPGSSAVTDLGTEFSNLSQQQNSTL